jgi:hypothetical protein
MHKKKDKLLVIKLTAAMPYLPLDNQKKAKSLINWVESGKHLTYKQHSLGKVLLNSKKSPSLEKSPIPKYYVYRHYDPTTKKTRYIGKGRGGRAWEINSRSDTHRAWLECLEMQGYCPEDWVEILHKALLEDAALHWEKQEMWNHRSDHEDGLFNLTKIVNPNHSTQCYTAHLKGRSDDFK